MYHLSSTPSRSLQALPTHCPFLSFPDLTLVAQDFSLTTLHLAWPSLPLKPVEQPQCSRHCARWSTYIILFILNKTTSLSLSTSCRNGTWASEKWSSLLKVTRTWVSHGIVQAKPRSHLASSHGVAFPFLYLIVPLPLAYPLPVLLFPFLFYTKVMRHIPDTHF